MAQAGVVIDRGFASFDRFCKTAKLEQDLRFFLYSDASSPGC